MRKQLLCLVPKVSCKRFSINQWTHNSLHLLLFWSGKRTAFNIIDCHLGQFTSLRSLFKRTPGYLNETILSSKQVVQRTGIGDSGHGFDSQRSIFLISFVCLVSVLLVSVFLVFAAPHSRTHSYIIDSIVSMLEC